MPSLRAAQLTTPKGFFLWSWPPARTVQSCWKAGALIAMGDVDLFLRQVLAGCDPVRFVPKRPSARFALSRPAARGP